MSAVQQLVLAPNPDQAATDLYLVFPPSRGRAVRARVKALPGLATEFVGASRVHGQPLVLRFPLEFVDRTPPALRIELATSTEPLSPIYFVEDRGATRTLHTLPAPQRPGAPVFASHSTNAPLEALLLTPEKYRDLVLKSTGAPESSPLRAYFVDLEARSNPDVLPPGVLIRHHVEIVTRHLERRVRQRALLGRIDAYYRVAPRTARPSARLIQSVRILSRLQLELVRAHFHAGAVLDLGRFAQAFEQFALGLLRQAIQVPGGGPLTFWITEPSSAFYLLFAEFAFLACECNVDAAEWTALAGAMTYTQEYFARVYRTNEGVAKRFTDFKAAYFRANKRPSPAQASAIKAAAIGASVAGLRQRAFHTVDDHMPLHGAP